LSGLIVIPRINNQGKSQITIHTGEEVFFPVGRPVLVSKENSKTQFLDNHLLSNEKSENIADLLILLTNRFLKSGQLDQTIIKYLRGVVFWKNPEISKNKTISKNQVWVSFEEDRMILNIGGAKISMFDLVRDRSKVIDATSILFHNVNDTYLSKGSKSQKFYEITNVDVSKNTFDVVEWDSYEDYLLSDKNPDGSERPLTEIPLTTSVVNEVNPVKEDGSLIENYKPQYQGRYFVFNRGVTKKKGTETPANKTEEPSTKKLTVEQEAILNEIKELGKEANTTLEQESYFINLAYMVNSLTPGSYVFKAGKKQIPIWDFEVKIENGVKKFLNIKNSLEEYPQGIQLLLSELEEADVTLETILNLQPVTLPDGIKTYFHISQSTYKIEKTSKEEPSTKESQEEGFASAEEITAARYVAIAVGTLT
jgi:hypothetical protein